MKKLFKRNQVIITALAIMIAVAGYLNFTSDKQVLDTGVENLESEGAGGNEDDEIISASVEDTVDEEDVAVKDDAAGEDALAEGDDVAEHLKRIEGYNTRFRIFIPGKIKQGTDQIKGKGHIIRDYK